MTDKEKKIGVTPAFKKLRDDYRQLTNWLIFTNNLSKTTDSTLQVIAEILLPHESDAEFKRTLEKSVRSGAGAVKRFRKFQPLLRELVTVRSVDSYLCYITEIIKLIHESTPELLSSDHKISYREIMEIYDLEEILDYMIERRVTDLAFKGIRQLNIELRKLHGFSLFAEDEDIAVVNRLIEIRNLLVHNRGTVNRRFLERTDSRKDKRDKRVRLGSPADNMLILQLHAFSVDKRASKKFGIKRASRIYSFEPQTWAAVVNR